MSRRCCPGGARRRGRRLRCGRRSGRAVFDPCTDARSRLGRNPRRCRGRPAVLGDLEWGCPLPRGATSDGFHLVLDLGGGSLGRLQEHIAIADIGASRLSHAHPDHYADLFPLSVARHWGGLGEHGLPLLIPEGFFEHVVRALVPGTEEAWAGAFDMRTLFGGDARSVGPFSIETFEMPHIHVSLGFRVSADDTVLAFTGDTGPGDVVSELAAGADIFLADATYVDGGEKDFHLTARQAARYAGEAGVGALVLTHIQPRVDPATSLAQAREAFDGRILLAQSGLRI